MFIYLDKKREKFSEWLKRKTTLDFSDWAVFTLFLLGICSIYLFWGKNLSLSDKISATVLWFTGVVIMQYTKETYWLKQVNIKQLNYLKRPVVTLDRKKDTTYSIEIKNIGKGPALNIELRITQIHSNGGFTNLRNLATDEKRMLFNVGENGLTHTPYFDDIISQYLEASGRDFSHGEKNVFAIVATYEDINNNPYYTVALFSVNEEKRNYILKTTKIGDYKRGSLGKVSQLEWLK